MGVNQISVLGEIDLAWELAGKPEDPMWLLQVLVEIMQASFTHWYYITLPSLGSKHTIATYRNSYRESHDRVENRKQK